MVDRDDLSMRRWVNRFRVERPITGLVESLTPEQQKAARRSAPMDFWSIWLVENKDFIEARLEHAFRLRVDGLTGREIGERLGISQGRASSLYIKYAKREGRLSEIGWR